MSQTRAHAPQAAPSGEDLASARERKGWTKTQAAERAGVARSTVGRWESGSRPPQAHYLELLGLPSGALSPGDDPGASSPGPDPTAPPAAGDGAVGDGAAGDGAAGDEALDALAAFGRGEGGWLALGMAARALAASTPGDAELLAGAPHDAREGLGSAHRVRALVRGESKDPAAYAALAAACSSTPSDLLALAHRMLDATRRTSALGPRGAADAARAALATPGVERADLLGRARVGKTALRKLRGAASSESARAGHLAGLAFALGALGHRVPEPLAGVFGLASEEGPVAERAPAPEERAPEARASASASALPASAANERRAGANAERAEREGGGADATEAGALDPDEYAAWRVAMLRRYVEGLTKLEGASPRDVAYAMALCDAAVGALGGAVAPALGPPAEPRDERPGWADVEGALGAASPGELDAFIGDLSRVARLIEDAARAVQRLSGPVH